MDETAWLDVNETADGKQQPSALNPVEIRPLLDWKAADLRRIGGGYVSTACYTARKTESPEQILISLELTPLETPYIKRWEDSDEEELEHYQQYAAQGYSLAAYDGEQMIGLALCEARHWNRTLWVWEFHVAETHRGRGIGRQLMEAVVEKARESGFRIVGLETQNTNVPAITFYHKVGFEIDGIDLSFYTNDDMIHGEVAIFMKRKL